MSSDMSRTVTLNELMDTSPVLRLRLTNAAKELEKKKPDDPTFIQKTKTWVEKLFSTQNINIDLEHNYDEETTQRNKEKVRQLFDKLHKRLDEQQKSVEDSMDGLNPQQQEAVIAFWTEAFEFLSNIFIWIRDVFNKVINMIREGWKLVNGAVSSFFYEIWILVNAVL